MNESFSRLIYTLLPCLVGAYAAALLDAARYDLVQPVQ